MIAVTTTVLAIGVILVKIIVDGGGINQGEVSHPNPSVKSFSLAFGAILFSFGGASVFPTVQNDMKKRKDFWKSVITSFVGNTIGHLPKIKSIPKVVNKLDIFS